MPKETSNTFSSTTAVCRLAWTPKEKCTVAVEAEHSVTLHREGASPEHIKTGFINHQYPLNQSLVTTLSMRTLGLLITERQAFHPQESANKYTGKF